jgi:hypothetical protein
MSNSIPNPWNVFFIAESRSKVNNFKCFNADGLNLNYKKQI